MSGSRAFLRPSCVPNDKMNAVVPRAPLFIRWAVFGYAVAVLAALVLLRAAGDRWWLATALTYGPRWVILLPAAPLAILTTIAPRRVAATLAAATLLAAGPVMAFNVPLAIGGYTSHSNPTLTIVTVNLNSGRFDPARLTALLRHERPDITFVQECDVAAVEALRTVFPHVREDSSLCIAAWDAVTVRDILGRLDASRDGAEAAEYVVQRPAGPIRVANIHLDTPRSGLELVLREGWGAARAADSAITARARESAAVSEWLARSPDLAIIAGDFNQTVDSVIFQTYWTAYRNAFSEVGAGFGHTKFTRWFGARIDHILTATTLEPIACRVAADVGSDHRPLVATVASRELETPR